MTNPNKINSLQIDYTKPTPIYKNTKANIEALSGLIGGEEAYATDTGEWGHYDFANTEWVWHGTGGGTWGSITGTLSDQTDLQSALASKADTSHTHDASAITFTPATNADWNSSTDPGDVDNALDQLAERVTDLESGGTGREVLTANRTYYVRNDGSDSNTGLVDSAGGAFLTLDKARQAVEALDRSIYNVIIQIADGTYTAGCTFSSPTPGSGTITIQGNSSSPANVLISVSSGLSSGNGVIQATSGASIIVKDLKITTSASGTHCLRAGNGGVLIFSNIDFGSSASAHIRAEDGGRITCSGNYTITGSATRHWFGTAGTIRVL
jgi:hypothetical protein